MPATCGRDCLCVVFSPQIYLGIKAFSLNPNSFSPVSFRPEQCVALRSGEIWPMIVINLLASAQLRIHPPSHLRATRDQRRATKIPSRIPACSRQGSRRFSSFNFPPFSLPFIKFPAILSPLAMKKHPGWNILKMYLALQFIGRVNKDCLTKLNNVVK